MYKHQGKKRQKLQLLSEQGERKKSVTWQVTSSGLLCALQVFVLH